MVIYNCVRCDFSTHLKSNYKRHLKTLKHQFHYKNYEEVKIDGAQMCTTKESMCTKSAQNVHECAQKCTNLANKSIFCKFCNKKFKYRQSMLRHQRQYCKKIKVINDENIDLKDIIKNQSQKISKIEQLLKINNQYNTQINQSNNTYHNTININNYGEENLDMLTDEFKRQCVTRPYYALTKIIEKIHFNDEYPENKNIRLVNKRDNKVQILNNGKWNYRDKEEAIKYALDESNEKLGKFYDEKFNQCRKILRMSCKEIIKSVQESDPELMKILYKEMDLILFNN